LTQDGNKLVWKENADGGSDLFQVARPNTGGQGFNANQEVGLPAVGNIISFGQGNKYVGGVNK